MKTLQQLLELRFNSKKMVKSYGDINPETGKWERHNPPKDVEVDKYYPPEFVPLKRKTEIGDIRGTTGDWLAEMGATPEDIAPGRKMAVESPEYKRMINYGFKDISSPGEVKTGTIAFSIIIERKGWGGAVQDYTLIRRVHLNGNIRTHADGDVRHAGRGRTYHPMTTKTHPDLTGAERIAGSMRASMRRIVDMYKKEILKSALNNMVKNATKPEPNKRELPSNVKLHTNDKGFVFAELPNGSRVPNQGIAVSGKTKEEAAIANFWAWVDANPELAKRHGVI